MSTIGILCSGPRMLPCFLSKSGERSTNPTLIASFEEALKTLVSLGATVVDNVEIPSQDEWDAWDSRKRRRALEAEFKASIDRWCGSLVTNPEDIKSLDHLIDFIKKDPNEAYPSEISRDSSRLRNHRESMPQSPKTR